MDAAELRRHKDLLQQEYYIARKLVQLANLWETQAIQYPGTNMAEVLRYRKFTEKEVQNIRIRIELIEQIEEKLRACAYQANEALDQSTYQLRRLEGMAYGRDDNW